MAKNKVFRNYWLRFSSLWNSNIYALSSVWSYVDKHGQIMADSAEIETAIGSIKTTSEKDSLWKSSLCYPKPYIANLKDVVILPGKSIILDNSGRALSDEIDLSVRIFGLPPKHAAIEAFGGSRLHIDSRNVTTQQIFSGIHLHKEHEANYFHWIVEVLPRLFICEKLALDYQIPILVSNDLHTNLYDLLDRVREPRRAVLKLEKSCWYRIQRLTYPSDLSRILDVYDRPPSTDTTYIPVALLSEMASSIKKTAMPSMTVQKKRIFLRRGPTYRKLLNEADVEKMLEDYGFETINLSEMSIEEQIGLFLQVDVVVGPSGAGMTNMIWCEPSTKFLILHSDHPFKKYPYWDALGRVSGSQINYFSGPRAFNMTGHYEAHDDYSVDLQALRPRIEALLNE